jgi:FkbM family methyltransferase
MAACDFFDRRRGVRHIATKFGELTLDTHHHPQRMLAHYFRNHLAFYRHSELGRYIGACLRSSDAFLDVGANLGMYSLLASECGAQRILFEPEPDHAKFLEKNARIFGTVLPVAVSDRAGTLPFYEVNPKNSGAASLVRYSGQVAKAMVRVDTLSNLIAALPADNRDRIRLIKIDVEGAENDAVNGLRDYLSAGARPMIWCEVRGDTGGRSSSSFRPVVATLKEFGYRPYEPLHARTILLNEEDAQHRTIFDIRFESN